MQANKRIPRAANHRAPEHRGWCLGAGRILALAGGLLLAASPTLLAQRAPHQADRLDAQAGSWPAAQGAGPSAEPEPALAAVQPPGGRPSGSLIKNITAQNGQSVILHCLVEPSSELVVSWFRGVGEPQLLTSETNTLIDDPRFVVRHGLIKENDWALQIRNLDKSTDSGLYQCQTNTEPPQSQFYQLIVIEPQVNIMGAPDMIVKAGSLVNLTCVVSQSPGEMPVVFWYKNDKMINYNLQDRGKIVMSKFAHKSDSVISNLQIYGSKSSDSANYTCSPSGARSSSILVHVLEGLDKRLIMFQNDNYESSSSNQLTASSQQQTNSALSVHVIRLSKGRVYALFVAFIIFASWFQLVAQLQTAISLLLLAIIGFFIGKVTEAPLSPAQITSTQTPRKGRWKTQQLQLSASSTPESEIQPDASTTMPLIGHSPGSHLKIRDAMSSASEASDDETNGHSRNGHPSSSPPDAHITSPSGSASSATSTGYNSDSRSADFINRRRRHLTSAAPRSDDMIELVSGPTAMRLVMDQFGCGLENEVRIRQRAARWPVGNWSSLSSPAASLSQDYQALDGARCRVTQIDKPPEEALSSCSPTEEDNTITVTTVHDAEESHYSSPVSPSVGAI